MCNNGNESYIVSDDIKYERNETDNGANDVCPWLPWRCYLGTPICWFTYHINLLSYNPVISGSDEMSPSDYIPRPIYSSFQLFQV